MMPHINLCDMRTPHPPFGHLVPKGRRGNRDVAACLFSPWGEGGGSRMRGSHLTAPIIASAFEGAI
jgi:hypothetical protein